MFEYTAKSRDTWDIICFKFYSSYDYINELIKANEMYIDTVVFEGGEIILIPAVSDPSSKAVTAPWRETEGE